MQGTDKKQLLQANYTFLMSTEGCTEIGDVNTNIEVELLAGRGYSIVTAGLYGKLETEVVCLMSKLKTCRII